MAAAHSMRVRSPLWGVTCDCFFVCVILMMSLQTVDDWHFPFCPLPLRIPSYFMPAAVFKHELPPCVCTSYAHAKHLRRGTHAAHALPQLPCPETVGILKLLVNTGVKFRESRMPSPYNLGCGGSGRLPIGWPTWGGGRLQHRCQATSRSAQAHRRIVPLSEPSLQAQQAAHPCWRGSAHGLRMTWRQYSPPGAVCAAAASCIGRRRAVQGQSWPRQSRRWSDAWASRWCWHRGQARSAPSGPRARCCYLSTLR